MRVSAAGSRLRNASLTVVVLALVGACADHEAGPTAPAQSIFEASNQGQQLHDTHRPHERLDLEIARRYPAYAGFYLEGRQPRVRVTDLAAGAEIAAEVLRLFQERRGVGIPTPIVEEAEFTFLELAGWRDVIAAELFGRRETGIVSLDVEVRRNRVVVGVLPEADMEAARERVSSLGIPLEAVVFVEESYVVPDRGPVSLSRSVQTAEKLTQWWDTIVGGIQYEYKNQSGSGKTCTLGPMVLKNYNSADGTFEERGYLTVSHCSTVPYDTDVGTNWQNRDFYSDNVIGTETLDPKRMTGPIQYEVPNDTVTREVNCQDYDGCRWSDAAYTTYDTAAVSRPHGMALVAEPDGKNTTEVNQSSMGFQVSGEVPNPVEGDSVHKVGKNSGWTSGEVKFACKDYIQSDLDTGEDTVLLCQDWADYSREKGDSGAPVFLFDSPWSDDVITIVGVHNSKSGSGLGVFSAVANIEEDLGFDLHFGPWFY